MRRFQYICARPEEAFGLGLGVNDQVGLGLALSSHISLGEPPQDCNMIRSPSYGTREPIQAQYSHGDSDNKAIGKCGNLQGERCPAYGSELVVPIITLPGFMMPWGSNKCFSFFIQATLTSFFV